MYSMSSFAKIQSKVFLWIEINLAWEAVLMTNINDWNDYCLCAIDIQNSASLQHII